MAAPPSPPPYATPLAAYTAIAASSQVAGCPPSPTVPVTGDLPARLDPKRFTRAVACATNRNLRFSNTLQHTLCGETVYQTNPWVDCARGAILNVDAAGTYYLVESPCLLGYGATEFKVTDLDGNVVCSIYPTIPNPQPPKVPQPIPGGNPTNLGGGTFPKGGGGGGALPISINGLNLNDVARLLGGLGAGPDLTGVLAVLAALVAQGGNI